MPGKKTGCRGLTLIEMMIVVAMIGTLTAIGYPMYETALQKARVAKAVGDIRTISNEIGTYRLFQGSLPLSLGDIGMANFLDPYGNAYEYLNFFAPQGQGQGPGQVSKAMSKKSKGQGAPGQGGTLGEARKDQFLVPINSDYDLYSKGQDGLSQPPLTAVVSLDDIIRANDGGYIGLASEY